MARNGSFPKQFYKLLFITMFFSEIVWVVFKKNSLIVSGISKCTLPSLFNDILAGDKILG